MRIVLMAAALSAALTGCGGLASGDSSPFRSGVRGSAQDVEGIRFRSRVARSSEAPRRFTVTTRRADRALTQALEAGRLEGIRYCLTRFGGSEIEWIDGPDRPIETIATDERGLLVMRGTCLSR